MDTSYEFQGPKEGFLRVTRGHEDKRRSVTVYTSDAYGYIRNAETGVEYKQFRIGSRDEDLFYKVVLATGETQFRNSHETKYSNVLYFESPHRYAKHMMADVDQSVIVRWEERRRARLKDLEAELAATEAAGGTVV